MLDVYIKKLSGRFAVLAAEGFLKAVVKIARHIRVFIARTVLKINGEFAADHVIIRAV